MIQHDEGWLIPDTSNANDVLIMKQHEAAVLFQKYPEVNDV